MDGDKISSVGRGFFTAHGHLKSKEELKLDQRNQTQNSNNSSSAVNQLSGGRVSDVFNSLKTSFLSQANDFISVANRDRKNLKKARSIVKRQLKTARALKDAIKSGDQESADKLRSELQNLSEKRTELAASIKDDNLASAGQRVKNFNRGNKQLGILQLKPVSFAESTKLQLNTKKEVNNFIAELKDDRDTIKSQLNDLRKVRRELKGFIKQTRQALDSLQSGVIDSFGQATATANSISQAITNSGAQALLAHNLSEESVQALLG
ncbi:MAG: hypothetical protein D6719_07070 [Candidatus Dadabacteria bacterium]|nr:MAG: hypothetical protein D6719_07070 [Candidatus Dadabacteria bacterium]